MLERITKMKTLFLTRCLCIVVFIVLFGTHALAQAPAGGAKQSAAIHVRQGKEQFENKLYAAALRSLSLALRKDPHNSQAYLYRGKTRLAMGMPHVAINDFNRYIELKPSDAAGYAERGDAHNFNLDHETALSDYNTAIRLAPSSSSAYLGRGLAFTALAKYSEAIKDYQTVLRLNPNNPDALGNLGIACMLGGRPVEAMNYFERALANTTDLEWRRRIEEYSEKLLKSADGMKKPVRGLPTKPAGPVKNLW